jgi:hypothetical protein
MPAVARLRLGEHHHAAYFAALEAMLPKKRGRQKRAEHSYVTYTTAVERWD